MYYDQQPIYCRRKYVSNSYFFPPAQEGEKINFAGVYPGVPGWGLSAPDLDDRLGCVPAAPDEFLVP